MHEYDVALSFAGEQRKEVEEVAALLTAKGVSVFLDTYEQANLWGKDLYIHLTDVYSKRARFCMIFASKAYAEKAWTNHERRSAQARAFQEKGSEYILPVRFEDTEIPGILPTVGYLDFARLGAKGICDAFLIKTGHPIDSSEIRQDLGLHMTSAQRSLIQIPDVGVALPLTESCSWGKEIALVLSGAENDALLSRMRSPVKDIIIVNGFDVAIVSSKQATRHQQGGAVSWDLLFSPQRTEFHSQMEMSSGGKSPDMFAEMRARRLLFGEFPAPSEDGEVCLQYMNQLHEEVMIRGLDTPCKIDSTRLPQLWKALNTDHSTFLEAAWLTLVRDLKVSSTVEIISKLNLTLHNAKLTIDFSGTRHKAYSNVPAYQMDLSGAIQLDKM